jgi:hypothetical protein
MSFNRLAPEDFVVSSDSITGPLWTGGVTNLTTFYSSSVQEAGSSGDFYLNVYQTSSLDADAEVQFAIAYGDLLGSGSAYYNNAVPGISPTRTIYGQYRTLVLGDENSTFNFGGVTASNFWAISIDRNRYKESLLPGAMTLILSSSVAGKPPLVLTDDSLVAPSVVFNDAGRVFQLISGSAGVPNYSSSNAYSPTQGSYGWLLPDIGTILINPNAVSESIELEASRSNNSDGDNYVRLFDALNLGGGFTMNSQETISSDYIFIRARNAEFNYSENPSFISGSTGEVLYNSFINNPQTFPTTIGLYNDTNELLAVAKLSRPLLKDFTKEALVRVKLDF